MYVSVIGEMVGVSVELGSGRGRCHDNERTNYEGQRKVLRLSTL